MTRVLGLALALWGGWLHAQAPALPQPPADPMATLRRITQATEKLSYEGTFVYQQGERSETSRITRLGAPGGDIERVEVLDGMPREIIRTRDTVRCYIPESQTIKVERRTDNRAFPGLLPGQIGELSGH